MPQTLFEIPCANSELQERERERDRDRERERERQTDRQTDRERERADSVGGLYSIF